MDEVSGYKEQLTQVEAALKINPDDTDLLGIKSELTELISISNQLYTNEPKRDNTNNNTNNSNTNNNGNHQKNERSSVDKKGKGKVIIDTLDIWEEIQIIDEKKEIVVEDQIPTYISISDNEDDNEQQGDDGDVVVLGAIAKPVSFVLSKKKVDFTLKLQEESESEGEDNEKERNNNKSGWFKNNMHLSRNNNSNSNYNHGNSNNNSNNSSGSYNSLTEWDKISNGKFSKMMEKMGYKRGTGLGKHGTGIVEALNPQKVTSQTLGLGYQKRPHSHIQNNNNNNNNNNSNNDASKRMKSSDVFSFLNKNIGGTITTPRNTQSTSIHNSSEEDLKAEVTRRQNDREKLLIKMQNLNQSLSRFTVRKENDDIVQSLKSSMEKVAKELEESNVRAEMAENRLKMKREKQKLMKF